MKKLRMFYSWYSFFVIAICLFFILPKTAYTKWVPVDWNIVTSGLSEIDKKVITDRNHAKLGSTYYRADSYSGPHSPIYSLQKSEDGGNNWITIETYGDYGMISNIDVIGSYIYLSRSYKNPMGSYPNSYLFRSEDGGATWNKIFENGMFYILGVAAKGSELYTIYGSYLKNITLNNNVQGPSTLGNSYSSILSIGSSLYIRSSDDVYQNLCCDNWQKIGDGFAEICKYNSDLYGFAEEGGTFQWVPEAPPPAGTNPVISLSVAGTTVSLSWSADNADKYILYAAPYPNASVIYDFDMGTKTSASFDLPYGSAYYVAIRASNSAGLSDWSNIEYFELSTPSASSCGAYVAPGVWKQFDCYNLAAIGKTTNDDPFTPSWRLFGGYWQWGRKGPSSSQRHTTNTPHFAHGPIGPGLSYIEANSGSISNWDNDSAPDDSWSDSYKTVNDPCPAGYRIPTITQWQGVIDNNTQSTVGTWDEDSFNYSSARFFGSDLMLPAAGKRSYLLSGELDHRGYSGSYWSSSWYGSGFASFLQFSSTYAETKSNLYRPLGFSVRCVAE
jgi:uncharacterized protein (TIGR02145 family)